MVRVICLLIGYCFGLFQTSYIYGRLHGIDTVSYTHLTLPTKLEV